MEDETLASGERGCRNSFSNTTWIDSARWLGNNPHAQTILEHLRLPMTAKQLSNKLDITLKSCSYLMVELHQHGLVCCCNPRANRSRLYCLTPLGLQALSNVTGSKIDAYRQPRIPFVDWDIYGWICFSHRSAVVRALTEPMRPADIKRKALFRDETLRMSANNVRDVIKSYLRKGIVRPVIIRHQAHTRYELTTLGLRLQNILNQSEAV